MKISIDMSHNPMRGYVACSSCGAPIISMRDEWHNMLAEQVARARGETYDRTKGTPRAWYPAMAEKAADMLASMAETYLFCYLCGDALQQSFRSTITDAPALPKTYGNTHKGGARWAQELGLADLPVGDYHKWQDMAFEQRKQGKVIWNGM